MSSTQATRHHACIFATDISADMARTCSLKSTVWLARHMAGDHLCPKDGEGWVFIAFIVYMVFGSYHAHRYKDYLGDGEVKRRLSRVIQECKEEAEEAEKSGEGGYMSSVMPERSAVTKRVVRKDQNPSADATTG